MVLLSACAVHTVFLDDDVLLVELLLDLPSRLSFSLGAFLAAEGSFSRTTYSLLLPAFPPAGHSFQDIHCVHLYAVVQHYLLKILLATFFSFALE